jgi:hypothetical protein
MRLRRRALIILLLFAALPGAAWGATTAGVLYELHSPSQRLWGCHAPCACPEIAAPTSGTFRLVEVARGPLFNSYALADINWMVAGVPGRWTGSGLYRVGGEFAVTHELVLDVEAGGVAYHYESGRIPGGGDFPRIDISAAAETVGCFHDVLEIHTAPASESVDEDVVLGRLQASPNPFESRVGFQFALRSPATISAVVVDLAGRRVRTLIDHVPFAAGAQSVAWDGRDGDGAPVRPGIYRLRMNAGKDEAWRTIARVW